MPFLVVATDTTKTGANIHGACDMYTRLSCCTRVASFMLHEKLGQWLPSLSSYHEAAVGGGGVESLA